MACCHDVYHASTIKPRRLGGRGRLTAATPSKRSTTRSSSRSTQHSWLQRKSVPSARRRHCCKEYRARRKHTWAKHARGARRQPTNIHTDSTHNQRRSPTSSGRMRACASARLAAHTHALPRVWKHRRARLMRHTQGTACRAQHGTCMHATRKTEGTGSRARARAQLGHSTAGRHAPRGAKPPWIVRVRTIRTLVHRKRTHHTARAGSQKHMTHTTQNRSTQHSTHAAVMTCSERRTQKVCAPISDLAQQGRCTTPNQSKPWCCHISSPQLQPQMPLHPVPSSNSSSPGNANESRFMQPHTHAARARAAVMRRHTHSACLHHCSAAATLLSTSKHGIAPPAPAAPLLAASAPRRAGCTRC